MIEIRELTKTFEGIRAVDNITTTIHEGQIFGLVGSNGAGKSLSLIHIWLCFVQQSLSVR